MEGQQVHEAVNEAKKASARCCLRLEGLIVLLAAVGAYWHGGHGWCMFALLFMAPDLSMLAYLKGPKFGAILYNAAHSYVGPAVLLTLAAGADMQTGATPAALIWFAHIGFCRMAGFGLKYESGFDDTHLGKAPFNLPSFIAGLFALRAKKGSPPPLK